MVHVNKSNTWCRETVLNIFFNFLHDSFKLLPLQKLFLKTQHKNGIKSPQKKCVTINDVKGFVAIEF